MKLQPCNMSVNTKLSRQQPSDSGISKTLQKLHLDSKNDSKPNYSRYGFEDCKKENIERCIYLLEHTGSCKNPKLCKEGEGCRRTKQVLAHYWTCLKMKNRKCSICLQLRALCEIHTERCQKKLDCKVPHFPNKKRPVQLLKKGVLEKSNLDSAGASDEYMQVVRKLVMAMRMPTVMEKKQHVLQLLKSDQQTTSDLLRKLYKMKISKIGAHRITSSAQIGNETSYSQVAIGNEMRDSDEPINDQPIMYRGKIRIVKT